MVFTDSILRNFAVASLSVPVTSMLLCASYLFRAHQELGFLPTYGNPDPKDLGWPIHHLLILLSLLAVIPALVFSGLLSICLISQGRQSIGNTVMFLTLGFGVGFTWLALSSFGQDFWGWYAD